LEQPYALQASPLHNIRNANFDECTGDHSSNQFSIFRHDDVDFDFEKFLVWDTDHNTSMDGPALEMITDTQQLDLDLGLKVATDGQHSSPTINTQSLHGQYPTGLHDSPFSLALGNV
jgi:hypothetical protein